MTTPLPSLPTAPNRSMPQGVFSPAMDAFLAALLSFRDALEANRPDIDQAIADAAQVALDLAAAQAARSAAEAAAMTAVNAPGTLASTSTSITPGVGPRSFTLSQTGKLFSAGMWVMVASAAAPTTNWIFGQISAFNASTGATTVQVPAGYYAGGDFADGVIALAPPPGTNNVPTSRAVNTSGIATGGGPLSSDVAITVAAATVADLWAGTAVDKAVTPSVLAAAAAFQTLGYASTVAWNTNTQGFNATIVLSGNPTVGAPTNLKDGWVYTLELVQDATGGRVPTWNAIWDWGAAAAAPTLQTGAGKRDRVYAVYRAATGKLHAKFDKGA